MTDAHTKIHDAENRLREGYDSVRETASRVIHDAGDKAAEALDASRETAKRTVHSLESNPLGNLVGGLAVGALAGELIPRSAREKQLLAPLGNVWVRPPSPPSLPPRQRASRSSASSGSPRTMPAVRPRVWSKASSRR